MLVDYVVIPIAVITTEEHHKNSTEHYYSNHSKTHEWPPIITIAFQMKCSLKMFWWTSRCCYITSPSTFMYFSCDIGTILSWGKVRLNPLPSRPHMRRGPFRRAYFKALCDSEYLHNCFSPKICELIVSFWNETQNNQEGIETASWKIDSPLNSHILSSWIC